MNSGRHSSGDPHPIGDASENAAEALHSAEQHRVLVAELNHRVRNMLQVVIGIANQTLKRSADLQEFERGFMGRMQALASAYELLSREGWRRISLRELMRAQLGAFVGDEPRCSLEGEDIDLSPNAALALGLVFYELATNATKYGAFSRKEGRVSVKWALNAGVGDQPQLMLHWVERGGPPVVEPQHTGFGTDLVRRQLQHELAGDARVEFREEGLEVTLTLPLRGAIESGRARV
jgi:two-component system, chemotaxis family, CheB/CheR fusion protein